MPTVTRLRTNPLWTGTDRRVLYRYRRSPPWNRHSLSPSPTWRPGRGSVRVQHASGRSSSAVSPAAAHPLLAGQGCTHVRSVTPTTRAPGDAAARVTLQTIADRLGVSRMTVSNAFSRPDQLSDELRLRVLSAAEALGYVGPDPAARALARGTTGAIGVLLTDALSYTFSDEVSTIFLGTLSDALAPTGMAVTLLTSNDRHDVVPARDVPLDGAIVYSCRPASPAPRLVGAPQAPARVRGSGARRRCPERQRRRPRRRPRRRRARDRARPPRRRHPHRSRPREHTQSVNACWVGATPCVRSISSRPWRRRAATSRTRDERGAHDPHREPRPTAVLCFSDIAALGTLPRLRSSGSRCPRDLSIVGFDDSPVARRSHPALTTVRQDLVAKGRLAADSLVSAMSLDRSRPASRGRHHVLPTELVIRETSGRAPY